MYGPPKKILLSKVPEKEACAMARAFWEEMEPLLQPNALPPSKAFMLEATRLSKTGHTHRFCEGFTKYGLAAAVSDTYVDIGLARQHPVLRIADFVECLRLEGKLDMLWLGNGEAARKDFWQKWQQLQPEHGVFATHANRLGSCLPVAVHCDEGTTLKKKALMIVQWQPLLGRGTRKSQQKGTTEPGCNYVGHSFTNRFLWSCCLARFYSGKKLNNKPLTMLLHHLSNDLSAAFHQGFSLGAHGHLYLVPIAMKGDWPALIKCGGLTRHFGRVSQAKPGKGICHLCMADQENYRAWHDISYRNMSRMRAGNVPAPWKSVPSLASVVPMAESQRAGFFKVDLFHTLHKGVFADICANVIALWPEGLLVRFLFKH